MKRIIFLLALTLTVCSCDKYKDDPVCAAIAQKAMEPYGDQPYKATFDSITLLDSTTLAVEMDRRINAFNMKRQNDELLYIKYFKQSKKKNAARKCDDMSKDDEILKKLNALKEKMGDSLNQVAYYDYKFTATVKLSGKTLQMKDCFATVTPDNEVITLSSDVKSLHKATGKVIPGYLELISDTPEEDAGDKEIEE